MRLLICVTVFFSAAFISAQAFARQPATAPAEQEAILAAFRDYNNAMMAGDGKTMAAHNHVAKESDQRLSDTLVAGDLAIGKFKNAAQEKFGGDAAKRVGKAAGDISNDDLVGATVRLEGNRSAVMVGNGAVPMIKVDGAWKFDLASQTGTEERAQQTITNYGQRTSKVIALTQEVTAGKFKTLDELIAAIAERDI